MFLFVNGFKTCYTKFKNTLKSLLFLVITRNIRSSFMLEIQPIVYIPFTSTVWYRTLSLAKKSNQKAQLRKQAKHSLSLQFKKQPIVSRPSSHKQEARKTLLSLQLQRFFWLQAVVSSYLKRKKRKHFCSARQSFAHDSSLNIKIAWTNHFRFIHAIFFVADHLAILSDIEESLIEYRLSLLS